jgi:uncharacterized membrane protein
MPLAMFVIMSFAIVLGAIVQCYGPSAFRSGLFFGVTVDPEFPRTNDARRIIGRYRRPIIVMAFVAMAALWLAVPRLSGVAAPLTASAIVMIDIAAGMFSMAAASRHVRAFAKPHSLTRTASLTPRPRSLPGGWLPFVGPMLILGGMGLWLFTRQRSMPPETFRAVLSALLVGFVAGALYMWVAWLVMFRMRAIRPVTENGGTMRISYWLRLLIAYFFVFFAVNTTVLHMSQITTARGRWFVRSMVVGWLAYIVIFLVLAAKGIRMKNAFPPAVGDNTPDECWKYGMFYYNPDDPAFLVESRLGPLGGDMNLGNRWSWVVSFGLVAIPILIRLVWF